MHSSEPASISLGPLIVIGASAGGIEALSRVLADLPANFAVPIVVAQHIDPGRPSLLAEVLRRASRVPVRTIEGNEPLQPGVVLVVPANRHVEVRDGKVLLQATDLPGPKPSVDRLLASAAAEFGEGLVAVILSGSGSDGAAGAHIVKQHGGMVVVENPQTAKFAGMPQSLAPSTVDVVADLERIGSLLGELFAGHYVPAHPDGEPALEAFLEDLSDRSGINFQGYKQPTVRRRLLRRLVATGSRSLQEYQGYLSQHPEEYQRLVATFLIKVTEFFRDADLFEHLRVRVLPDIIARAGEHGGVIRLWSAGCATGEEAYSLAIALCEALGSDLSRFDVRLFATDVDHEAVAFARRGVYPAAALSHLAPDLVARYFSEEHGGLAISKQVRSLLIFGQHDLGQRPPFPDIDLILCRNVLIYFTPELQLRALQLFAFALREGGYLALGKAEIAGPLSDFLRLEEPALKIYRRHGGAVVIPPGRIPDVRPASDMIRRQQPGTRDLGRRVASQPKSLRSQLELVGTAVLPVPVGIVVVTAGYDIEYINNAARRLLSVRGPTTGEDLVHAAGAIQPRLLKGLIDTAFREGTAVSAERVELRDEATGQLRFADVTCVPAHAPAERPPEYVTVALVDVSGHVEEARQLAADAAAKHAQGLAAVTAERDQLAAALAAERTERERQQTMVERLSASHDELDAANQRLATLNEELRLANSQFAVDSEEVQAASEEVETLNEELQATNEELETLNEELQATVEELRTANEDLAARSIELQELAAARQQQQQAAERAKGRLEAVLASMGSALVVVDRQGQVLLANEAYDTMLGALDGDVWVEDLDGHRLAHGQMPQQRAARGEAFTLEFVTVDRAGDRHWLEAVGRPLQDRGAVDGVPIPAGGVVVIRDVSDRTLRRLQDEFVAIASHELRTPVTAVTLYAQLLSRMLEASGQPDDRARQMLAALMAEARRMGLLVNDLMDARRLRSDRVRIERRRFDLSQVLRRCAELAQHLAGGTIVRLDLPDGEVPVDGDPNRMEQVVMNLLENAITYAEGTDRIDLSLRMEGQQAHIAVADHGPGIPAADLPHLFTRFYRSGRRRSGGGQGGLGLGLYIVHELVRAHGGRINVESTEGAGTTFRIALPLAS